MSTEPLTPIDQSRPASGWSRIIGVVLDQRVVVVVVTLLIAGWGLAVAPFSWGVFPDAEKLSVDAIPNIGENQQIVFAEWPGRAPEDIEDQVTYPLTSRLLGVAGVKTVRSVSMFGFTSIHVIFEEGVDFYWSRSRLLESIASLPDGALPEGVEPRIGPDATALGQVFWYTLEGRDEDGNPAGGWDLHELRTIQDFQVRYALNAVEGVSEVASVGGHRLEYTVEVDPRALENHQLTISDVAAAVSAANDERGGRETEINGVEYIIRGVGLVENVADIESAVVDYRDGTAIRVSDLARVSTGPAPRRGALDVGGAEAVGGVVAIREGANPMEAVERIREAVERISPSLPTRTLEDGGTSKVTIVPFYDRAELIAETVGTLERALVQQVLITVLVVLVILFHLRASILISSILPLAILATFLTMKATGMTANVVALSGIAIAIGTMVDMGIVLSESIVAALERDDERPRIEIIREAAAEVAGAVWTASATTIVSFLPVLLLDGQEGRLFRPLALTKTYALIFSAVLAVSFIPVFASALLGWKPSRRFAHIASAVVFGAIGVALIVAGVVWFGSFVVLFAVGVAIVDIGGLSEKRRTWLRRLALVVLAAFVAGWLSADWMPLGHSAGELVNLIFVAVLCVAIVGSFFGFLLGYPWLLRRVLRWKLAFLVLPVSIVLTGLLAWQGAERLASPLPSGVRDGDVVRQLSDWFPGLGREFMPQLNEGSFLYMPTTMPHASIGETLEMMAQLDMLIEEIPEVETAVGKLGRADTALDPAPVSMIETIIEVAPEFRTDASGRRLTFEVDENGAFVRDEQGALVPSDDGQPYRNWRDHIRSREDIWEEIVANAQVPGLTSAPLLQPISTRLLMLQSGIRAPMAIRLQGGSLEQLAELSVRVETWLRQQPAVRATTVNADRPVGKPYIDVVPDREELAQYGITMAAFQREFSSAVAGSVATTTVEGRESYRVRVRYPRELRDDPEAIKNVRIRAADGAQVPLGQLADVRYRRGPQAIKSEDAQLSTYVMFAGAAGTTEVDVVNEIRGALDAAINGGDVAWTEGVTYTFTGNYENAERAEKRLQWLVPLVLVVIVLLLYLQFRSFSTVGSVFASVVVSLSAGFILLWLCNVPGFLGGSIAGLELREVFRLGDPALSVAVWVGFIALFGIATDDGVVMATRLDQVFSSREPRTVAEVRLAVVEAGTLRARACVMTTATTILALLPVLTSYGPGANIMIPMAIPILGGMAVEILALFLVPLLYAFREERRARAA